MMVQVNTPNKGSVNMRAEPNKLSKVLAQIPNKTSLESEQIDSTWSKVTYQGQTGYVMTEFLSTDKIITKNDLEQVYNSLKTALKTIEKILK